jgi:uncharacterized protein (TIGR00297 family)
VHTFPTWAVGAALAAVIALTALRFRALSSGGGIAAFVAGTVAMGAGWSWGILLIAYFVTSTALSRYGARMKALRVQGRLAKAGARDAIQVLANGGVFVAAALAWWVEPRAIWQAVGAGAIAASAADTWATELGTLSPSQPRSILTGDRVPPGTSGGVTVQGYAAALAGVAFVAVVAATVGWPPTASVAALAGGLVGSTADSLLGASVQARFWCDGCGTMTETRRHECGSRTSLRQGWGWMDNDAVNACATACGAACGAASAVLLG